MDGITQNQLNQDIVVNAALDALQASAIYGYRAQTSSGLTFGYYGGVFTKLDGTIATIAAGTFALNASATNYVVAAKATGTISVAVSTTNWNDTANYHRLWSVVTGASSVTSKTDYRELGALTGAGRLALTAPVTKTGNFTLAEAENEVICNGTASITVTLPAASSWVGRKVRIKTIAAFTVVSASSNVVPIDSATAGTAILAATAGKWAQLVSDGTNWVIMAAN